jgi:phosphoribosylanthranilate isomerase
LTIGVFRNETPERVIDIVGRTGLKGVQLHGGETAEELRLVRLRVPFVIQALPAGDPRLAGAGVGPEAADVVLIDAPTPGSGEVFDWSLAEGAPDGVRLLLAGGLDPDNVEAAIRKVRPWGVDSASGTEASPGKKDATKVRLFVARAKGAGKALEEGWTPESEGPYNWAEDGT